LPPASANLFVPSTWQTSKGMLLFCFPYAGGSPYLFREWGLRLQTEIQVIAFPAPGHGTRLAESPHRTVQQVVADVIEGSLGIGNRPFALYGHSLGALIAFEFARQLRREGRPQPRHLFVGGSRPPHLGPIMPPLHRLPEPEFLSALESRYSGMPAAILNNPEILAIFLPALRADFAAYESHIYQAELPLACPISSFAGDRDALIPAETVAGWEKHTSAAFDLQVLRGGHFFLEESRAQLLDAIRRELL
jgi:medium-chain acyl-[acyl-carrier-protein] hydrolase